MHKIIIKHLNALLIAILLLVATGCPQKNLSVEIKPETATVVLGQTQLFMAKVTPKNAVITWSIDEGPSSGTITSGGLYTAPVSLPSSPVATVRASCVADPAVSDTALVTIVSNTGTTTTTTVSGNTTTTAGNTSTTTTAGSLTPEEKSIYLLSFNIGFDLAQLGSDITEIAIESVWKASELNGGYETKTGTLTQSGNDFNYSSQPSDKLVVSLSDGTNYEFIFSRFDGFKEGDAQAFFYSHHIEFTAKSGSTINLQVNSYSPYQNDQTELNRRTTGTCIYNIGDYSYQTNIDITQTGTLKNEVDGWSGYAEQIYNTQCSGAVNISFGQFNINEQYFHHYLHSSSSAVAVWDRQRMSNTGAHVNGNLYQLQNAYVHWISSSSLYGNNEPNSQWYGVVEDAHQWEASGAALKNGSSIGQTQFDVQPVNGTYGPFFILNFADNSRIVLHKLLNIVTG
jgi:hypothetical protein